VGTFHHDKHQLHGITVVVETHGPRVFVGRCDDIDEAGVILLDADVHESPDGGASKQEYLRRAAQVGIWKKHDRVVVPRQDVASVIPLADLPID
jgi:hypothetical protein